MSALIHCPECGRERRNRGRGLCSGCYTRLRDYGRLDNYPSRKAPGTSRRVHVEAYEADWVVVERILGGEWGMPSNPAERAEVCRRWDASGRALNDLSRLTGWLIWRYYRKEAAA